jgi:serine/threonine-protein phosphatase 5
MCVHMLHVVYTIKNVVMDASKMEVDASYDGPRLEGEEITLDFVHAMIERFKDQKMIHRK